MEEETETAEKKDEDSVDKFKAGMEKDADVRRLKHRGQRTLLELNCSVQRLSGWLQLLKTKHTHVSNSNVVTKLECD